MNIRAEFRDQRTLEDEPTMQAKTTMQANSQSGRRRTRKDVKNWEFTRPSSIKAPVSSKCSAQNASVRGSTIDDQICDYRKKSVIIEKSG